MGEYVRFPNRDELNQEINETYVVEWYNRLV
jgi:small subunit ribosomal protein S4